MLLEFNPSTYSDLLYTAKKNNVNLKLLNFRRPAIWNINSFKVIIKSGCEIINIDTDKKSDDKINTTIDNLKNFPEMNKIFSIQNKSFWFFIKEDFINFCVNRFSQAFERLR